jgi:hypothetical protein
MQKAEKRTKPEGKYFEAFSLFSSLFFFFILTRTRGGRPQGHDENNKNNTRDEINGM